MRLLTRRRTSRGSLVVLVLFAALSGENGCGDHRSPTTTQTTGTIPGIATVDSARIIDANQTPGDWMTYGRTYSEQRFSPLQQVTDQNVKGLQLAWYFDLDTKRGQESTPLVIGGDRRAALDLRSQGSASLGRECVL